MIGIIFIGDLKYCPYISKYEKILKETNQEYEIIFWNRSNEEIIKESHYISFSLPSKLSKSKFKKIGDFLKYRNWLKKILIKKKYNKLILLSTLSGIIIMDEVLKNYNNNYILDIRDYSYEGYYLYYKSVEKLIEESNFTVISSEGFKEFLPKSKKYILIHNYTYQNFEINCNELNDKSEITLLWLGVMRYFEHQKKIIDHLKNNKKFKMIYYGDGPQLEEYLKYKNENKIKNLEIKGYYDNSEKHEILSHATIINNSYRSSNINETKHALSNKYYDGIKFNIPQLVETNSYKADLIVQNKNGIALDVNNHEFSNLLYDYVNNINYQIMADNNQSLLNSIKHDQLIFERKVKNFLLNEYL